MGELEALLKRGSVLLGPAGGVHAAPSTGHPLLCQREKTKASMPNKLREFRDVGCCRSMPRLGGRTTALLLLAVMLAGAQASWPQGSVEVLGDVGQLEASMHSAVFSSFQEAEVTTATASQPSGFPDSSAVVGRVFQMRIPTKAKDSSSTVKVRPFPPHNYGYFENWLQMYAREFIRRYSSPFPFCISEASALGYVSPASSSERSDIA